MRTVVVAPLLAGALLTGCSSDASGDNPTVAAPSGSTSSESSTGTGTNADQKFPDVVSAELTASGDTFTLSVTMTSPYDTPERYADGWRVLAPDGTVLGDHLLDHDHASEQPFTRQQSGLKIPGDVDTVSVEGRDKANGYGGKIVKVPVTRS